MLREKERERKRDRQGGRERMYTFISSESFLRFI